MNPSKIKSLCPLCKEGPVYLDYFYECTCKAFLIHEDTTTINSSLVGIITVLNFSCFIKYKNKWYSAEQSDGVFNLHKADRKANTHLYTLVSDIPFDYLADEYQAAFNQPDNILNLQPLFDKLFKMQKLMAFK